MATVNDICSLTEILSDLCTTLMPIYFNTFDTKHYCKFIANNMNYNLTLTTWMPPSCKLCVM